MKAKPFIIRDVVVKENWNLDRIGIAIGEDETNRIRVFDDLG